MTPYEERQLNGRIGALESWSRTPDRKARTTKATQASPVSVDYWLTKVDPDQVMTEGDRRKAAENARRAHMLRLAKASVTARAARRKNP